MINRRKDSKADLKRSYNVYLEVGLIVALLFIIAAVRINLYSPPPTPPPIEEQEEVVMEEAIQTKQIETPPPPPRPPVPVEVPNDEIIEDEILDIAEFDLDGPMDLPPPPPPAEDEEEEIFIVVENMPELRGGQAGLQ
ncbi:MAG TPA: energy transducer TonB, partial [Balneola sp.]|nr:energy transducer TonB [Balneola sp.]